MNDPTAGSTGAPSPTPIADFLMKWGGRAFLVSVGAAGATLVQGWRERDLHGHAMKDSAVWTTALIATLATGGISFAAMLAKLRAQQAQAQAQLTQPQTSPQQQVPAASGVPGGR